MSSSTPAHWDVFLAHAGADRAVAEAFHDRLSPAVRVYLDTRALRPGDVWPRELERAIRASRVVVVLVSAHVRGAHYLLDEIAIAVSLARSDPARYRVVPVLLGDAGGARVELPYGLTSLHGLFARTPDEMDACIRSLRDLIAGDRFGEGALGDVWRPSAAAALPEPAGPDTLSGARFQPLRLLTDDGRELIVGDPAGLAAALDDNPVHGAAFVDGRFYTTNRWAETSPGLCAALDALRTAYPGPEARLTAALYVLDRRRPYRGAGETLEGWLPLAAHVASHAAHYRVALTSRTHRLWIHLAAQGDPAVREALPAFVEALAGPGAPPDPATATVVVNRLVLWLRGRGGDRRLPFADRLLTAPADALSLPPGARRAFAAALADETSLESLWVGEAEPALAALVAIWRAVRGGDPEALEQALGAGVPVGGGRLRVPADAFRGAAAALWAEDAEEARARVDRYLADFHGAPLAAHALAWLRDAEGSPLAGAVAAYVAAAHEDVGDPIGGPASLLLHGPEDLGGTEPAVSGILARRTEGALRAVPPGSDRLLRLAEWLNAAVAATPGARGPVQAERWTAWLRSMDPVLAELHRDAYASAADPPDPQAVDGALDAALAAADAEGIALPFAARHRAEMEVAVEAALTIDAFARAAGVRTARERERALGEAAAAARSDAAGDPARARILASLGTLVLARRIRWALLAAAAAGAVGVLGRAMAMTMDKRALVAPSSVSLLDALRLLQLDPGDAGFLLFRIEAVLALLIAAAVVQGTAVLAPTAVPPVVVRTAMLSFAVVAGLRLNRPGEGLTPAVLTAGAALLLLGLAIWRTGSRRSQLRKAAAEGEAAVAAAAEGEVRGWIERSERARGDWARSQLARARRSIATAPIPAWNAAGMSPPEEPALPGAGAEKAPAGEGPRPVPRARIVLAQVIVIGGSFLLLPGVLPPPERSGVLVTCYSMMDAVVGNALLRYSPRRVQSSNRGLFSTTAYHLGPYRTAEARRVVSDVQASLRDYEVLSGCNIEMQAVTEEV